MDIASLAGVLLAFGLLIAAVVMTPGSSLGTFLDIPSLLIVFGGSLAATLITVPLRTFLRSGSAVRKIFVNRSLNIAQLVGTMVELAEVARREGLLALEQKLPQLQHPLLVAGVQMAIDGTRPEAIEEVLRTEMVAGTTRHRESRAVIEQMGRFAPAFGMMGTLIGLILMLGDIRDLPSIGTGMAIALLTTLYGVVAANVLFLPFAEKLTFLHKQEILAMEIIVRGLVAIQSGDNPRMIQQKLGTFLEPGEQLPVRQAA